MSDARSNAGSWRPVLTGPERGDVLTTVNEIGRAVRQCAGSMDDASLSHGLAGFAVLFAELHRVFPDEGYDTSALKCADRAGKIVGTVRMSPALYWGFPGVAWAISHVNEQLRPGARDRLGGIDDVLWTVLGHQPWRGVYDLISGLVGLGV